MFEKCNSEEYLYAILVRKNARNGEILYRANMLLKYNVRTTVDRHLNCHIYAPLQRQRLCVNDGEC